MQIKTYAFVSTMRMLPWGGSEVLWSKAAQILLQRGVAVCTRTTLWPKVPLPLTQLEALGATLAFDSLPPTLAQRVRNRLLPNVATDLRQRRVRKWLATLPSPGVVLSCGSILDDFSALADLSHDRIPYVVIVQAAGPEIWPADASLPVVSKLLHKARRVVFVSQHNRDDVQSCVGQVLDNAEVLPNPAALPDATSTGLAAPSFPSTSGLSLASVARLDVGAKGHDIVLRVLARPEWRERDVSLTLYGTGPHRLALENAVRYFGLKNITFAGQVSNVAVAWTRHNLGILASRYEGLPLGLIEAMTLGRANVVPATCGSAEIVHDNRTGFVASAPTPDAVAEALERAWQRRPALPSMGAAAARSIRELLSLDPAQYLADRLPTWLQDESDRA